MATHLCRGSSTDCWRQFLGCRWRLICDLYEPFSTSEPWIEIQTSSLLHPLVRFKWIASGQPKARRIAIFFDVVLRNQCLANPAQCNVTVTHYGKGQVSNSSLTTHFLDRIADRIWGNFQGFELVGTLEELSVLRRYVIRATAFHPSIIDFIDSSLHTLHATQCQGHIDKGTEPTFSVC